MSFFQKFKMNSPIAFLGGMTLAGAVFTLIFLAVTGNQPQTFNDIILERTAYALSNKSAEMFLAYFLPLAGLVAYTCYYGGKLYRTPDGGKSSASSDFSRFMLSAVVGITLFVFLGLCEVNVVLAALCLFLWAAYRYDAANMLDDLLFFLLSLFTVYSLYCIYAWCAGNQPFNSYVAVGITTVWSGIVCLGPSCRKACFQKSVLVMQALLPALLLVYVADRYGVQDQIVVVKPLLRVRVLVYGIIAGLVITNLLRAKKYWGASVPLNQLVSFGTCIAVAGFLVSSAAGLQLPTDLHHPFENVIGFQQLFQLGQKAFVQYIPVSGMYSVVHGAFFQIFGAGLVSHYYITEALFFWMVTVLVLLMLRVYFKPSYLFLVTLLLIENPSVYSNRSIFILPVMLLLSYPKLMEHKNTWLQVWLLTGLFQGLYYPVYGAAVCLAFLPLGIYQTVTFITSGDFRRQIRQNGFLLKWCVCLIPVLLAVPWLRGTYQHIRAMAAQTVLADGISRFGQQFSFPLFLPAPLSVRLVIGYLLTFLLPAVVIWGAYALALYVARINKYEKINLLRLRDGCVVLSLVIFPLVAFSYTMVRLDVDSLFARNTSVLVTMGLLLVLYALRYGRSLAVKKMCITVAVCIPLFASSWGILTAENKLQPYIKVPDNFVQIQSGTLPHTGAGFIQEPLSELLQHPVAPFQQSFPYFGLPVFGFYYFHQIKGSSVLEPLTLKSFGAVQETVDLLKQYPSFVYPPADSEINYYFYHYLVTSGDYVHEPGWHVFRPSNNTVSAEQIRQRHLALSYGNDIFSNKAFAAWGQSIESLRPIFSTPNVSFETKALPDSLQITFSKPLYGDDADFMYIEFDGQEQFFEYALYDMAGWHKLPGNLGFAKYFVKKNFNPQRRAEISWTDENGDSHKLFSGMDKGKLLIPLGTAPRWLLEHHTSLQIRVTDNALPADFPPVKKIEFLKLREVR